MGTCHSVVATQDGRFSQCGKNSSRNMIKNSCSPKRQFSVELDSSRYSQTVLSTVLGRSRQFSVSFAFALSDCENCLLLWELSLVCCNCLSHYENCDTLGISYFLHQVVSKPPPGYSSSKIVLDILFESVNKSVAAMIMHEVKQFMRGNLESRKSLEFEHCWAELCRLGSKFGYYTETWKSWVIVKVSS